MQVFGTISTTDGTSKNNGNTASTFSLGTVGKFSVQPTVDVYVRQGNSSVAATSADFKIPADAIVDIELFGANAYLAMIPVSASGSASLKCGLR